MRTQTLALVTVTALVGFAMAGLVHAPSASAGVYTVTSNADSGPGSFREAIEDASDDPSNPIVNIQPGLADIVLGSEVVYTSNGQLTVNGNGNTISGNSTTRIFLGPLTNTSATFNDLTLRNGAGATGAAVAFTANGVGPVRFNRVTFHDNHATGNGGALLSLRPTYLTDTLFTDNSAEADGGALWSQFLLSSVDSVFAGNAAAVGGAIRASSSVTIQGSLFERNTAADGGAVSVGGASVADIDQSTFVHNEATTGSGGALDQALGATDIDDSTFAENHAATAGGAMRVQSPALTNTTITRNDVVGDGAVGGGVDSIGQLTMNHTTIVENAVNGTGDAAANLRSGGVLAASASVIGRGSGAEDCVVVGFGSSGHNRVEDDSCNLAHGTDTQGPVPQLGGVRDNGGPTPTIYPLAGSPLVDAIPVVDCAVGPDQRGVARPAGGACDIGAIEQTYPEHGFNDVPGWVDDTVAWVTSDTNDPSLMTGITSTRFKANDPITRGQVVRLLYRLMGSPDVSALPAHGFIDVPGWVEDSVRWAKANNIATGITPTRFEPNLDITRAQVVRMVFRVAGEPPTVGLPVHGFLDVRTWVDPAVTWAANSNNPLPLVTGITPTTFRPNDPITRAQVARMVYRLGITRQAWVNPANTPITVPITNTLPLI